MAGHFSYALVMFLLQLLLAFSPRCLFCVNLQLLSEENEIDLVYVSSRTSQVLEYLLTDLDMDAVVSLAYRGRETSHLPPNTWLQTVSQMIGRSITA